MVDKMRNHTLKKSSKDLGISKKISILRHHFNLSAEAFGEKAGVSGTAISNIERGESLNPGAEMLVNISSMLGVNLNWLLLGEEPMLKMNSKQQAQMNLAKKKPGALPAPITAGQTVDLMMRIRNPDGSETITWIEAKNLKDILSSIEVNEVLFGGE